MTTNNNLRTFNVTVRRASLNVDLVQTVARNLVQATTFVETVDLAQGDVVLNVEEAGF